MMADEFPEMGARSPHSLGGSPVSILLYVENVDATFRQAVAAGAEELRRARPSPMATAPGRWSTRSAINGRSLRTGRRGP